VEERAKKFPLPWRERVRVRGIFREKKENNNLIEFLKGESYGSDERERNPG
jgi:hypothetical protein